MPLFDQLEIRAADCKTLSDFENWIFDGGALSAVLDEESSKRYIVPQR